VQAGQTLEWSAWLKTDSIAGDQGPVMDFYFDATDGPWIPGGHSVQKDGYGRLA